MILNKDTEEAYSWHVKYLLYLLELTPLHGVNMRYNKGTKRYKTIRLMPVQV